CQTITSRSGCGYGSGRSSNALMTEKMAVLAPMPSASVTIATSVTPRVLSITRAAYFTSCHMVVSSLQASGLSKTNAGPRRAPNRLQRSRFGRTVQRTPPARLSARGTRNSHDQTAGSRCAASNLHMTAALVTCALVLALQQPATPQAATPPAAEPPQVNVDDWPLSLERIQRALAGPPPITLSEQHPVFRLEIVGRKPTIEDILGERFWIGAAPYGGMTHAEFLEMVTPKLAQ